MVTAPAAVDVGLVAVLDRVVAGGGRHIRCHGGVDHAGRRVRDGGLGLGLSASQIERFDKDLKRVHDIGSAEILRQGKKRDKDSP